MEKGNIAHFEQFHLFPQCFPKGLFFSVLKQVYMEERVNSSPYDRILDRSKLKAFADDMINVTERLKSVLKRVENIVRKAENVGSPFLTMFLKAFYPRDAKTGSVWERVKFSAW